MRPAYVSLGAVGNTPWVPISQLQWGFGVGIAVTLSGGASLTYTVQHTYDLVDDTQVRGGVGISQTTTIITVTGDTGPPGPQGQPGIGSGLSIGDDVILISTQAGIDGEYPVASIISATSYTLTSPNSLSATGGNNSKIKSFRVFNNATLAASTTKGNTSYSTPITAVRLNISVYAGGVATMAVLQGVGS